MHANSFCMLIQSVSEALSQIVELMKHISFRDRSPPINPTLILQLKSNIDLNSF